MCAALGGRAAEEVIFGEISTGALSDLEKVTKQAYAMVSIYGLNEKIGNISYYDSQGREFAFSKPYSEDTARTIDEEASKIIEGQYTRAKQILRDNQENLEKLAEQLLLKEVIFKDDLVAIFGERPWDTQEPEEQLKEAAKEILEGSEEEDKTNESNAASLNETNDDTPPKDPNKVDH
jgi:cell division protease FtsH